ncbi:hypothetical protein [Enterobacter sp. 22466]|uniref:hypothetical protein n=1 Tax=Enterobacter sp. 22466 TaxID=3453924 RepID=UPI003F87C74A
MLSPVTSLPTWFKAHCGRSSEAAITYALETQRDKDSKFAREMIEAKISSIIARFPNAAGTNTKYGRSLQKYGGMLEQLKRVNNNSAENMVVKCDEYYVDAKTKAPLGGGKDWDGWDGWAEDNQLYGPVREVNKNSGGSASPSCELREQFKPVVSEMQEIIKRKT